MSARRIAAIALSGALVAGGAGAAIAATTKDDAKKEEQALLDDAAKRLSVTPQALRDALTAALDARLDEAVKNGDLTQKQADAIKQRRAQSGRVLGGALGGHRGFKGGPHPKGHGFGPRGAIFEDLAKALGITDEQLRDRLQDGKSAADIAKAEGKSLADVRTAVKASIKARLDKAVSDGDLTRKQADAMLEHLDEKLTNLDRMGPRERHRGRRGGPPRLVMPGARPGSFLPPAPGDAPVFS